MGQSVTFTATVTAASGTPTGTVPFFDGSTSLGFAALDGSGTAALSTSALPVGGHPITAAYAGSASFAPSTSAVTVQGVDHAATPGSATAVVGQPVAFSITVSSAAPGGGTPGGMVEVLMDGAPVITVALDGSGHATAGLTPTSTGSHSASFRYIGGPNFAASNAAFAALTVSAASTSTSLSASPSSTVVGMPATFTASVTATAPGAGVPSGWVTFMDGGTVLGTAEISGGLARFTMVMSAAGVHQIRAVYGGVEGYAGSSSAAQAYVVSVGTATIDLVVSTRMAQFGQSVTCIAMVSPASGSMGLPTGSVRFFDGRILLGQVVLVNGSANLTLPAQGVDRPHAIPAAYSGGGGFGPASSNVVGLTVSRAEVILDLAAGAFGRQIAIAASVLPRTGSGLATPTGTLTFIFRNRVVRRAQLVGGEFLTGFSPRNFLRRGMDVHYSGDAHYRPTATRLSSGPVFPSRSPSAFPARRLSSPFAAGSRS